MAGQSLKGLRTSKVNTLLTIGNLNEIYLDQELISYCYSSSSSSSCWWGNCLQKSPWVCCFKWAHDILFRGRFSDVVHEHRGNF